MPVPAPLGFTGVLPATDSPVGSQILSDIVPSEPGHISVSQDRTSQVAALHHDLSSALRSVAGELQLSYGTGDGRVENICGDAAGGCLTDLPVRSDQAWDLLTVGRSFFLQPWSNKSSSSSSHSL